ncbi:thiol peroxidase [Peptostreptococcus canis]|uniref:Thiol peroxidase n=1 Tax=Peptostreptococcus canis TaxID=1159213 RepID=A0ABR6TK06_9FIRM|nr:thiol peroxidase [Peptostreptococcus canis]MBC2575336.1 thiol peroxidase [Peptostreptococcus canis]MBP1997481.1 thiol peroxidase [Peptostreptococcus canis]
MEKRSITTFAGNPVTLLGKEIKVGDKAPEFVALRGDLSPFTLKDVEGKVKLISIVPSVDTGVCELQTIRFNQEASKLNDVAIITISCDLPFAQARFCGAKGIENAIVVSDYKDTTFGLNYGFLIEEFRLLNRGIVVIDKDDVVRYVEYVSEVTDHPDYDKALEAAKSL